MQELREQLRGAEDRIRSLREERARAVKVFETAEQAAEQDENDSTLNVAMAAKQSLGEVDSQLDEARGGQVRLLKTFGASATLPFAGKDAPPAQADGKAQLKLAS